MISIFLQTMASAVVASNIESRIRTLADTKGIRVREFFHDYDKLRSGFVSGIAF